MKWHAFQVHDFYDRPSQYRELIALLMSKYGRRREDIYVNGDGEFENQMCQYVFVKFDDSEFPNIWEQLSKEKYVRAADGQFVVPDSQVEDMIASSQKHEKVDFRYGDIVRITRGKYIGLFGIIVNVLDNEYEIGFNLFVGPRFDRFGEDDLKRIGSIFEIWKFPV